MRITSVTILLVLAIPAWPAEPAKLTDYFPPPESQGGWRTLLPEKGQPDEAQKKKIREVAGVDWDKLLDDSEKGKLPGGRKLTLDTKVCNKEWLPESLPLSDPRKADITLRHLLFATSGIPREGLKVPDEARGKAGPFEMSLGHVKGSPWAKLTGEPGTMFNYSSPGVFHLILVFNHAAGMDPRYLGSWASLISVAAPASNNAR
jgi:hypothetical protein